MNRLSRELSSQESFSPLFFVAVSASPAAAVVQFAHCSGTYEQTHDPGITNTPQDVDTTVLAVTGKVVAGKFVGAKMLRQSTFVQETLESECSSSEGLTQASGPATLTITKLL